MPASPFTCVIAYMGTCRSQEQIRCHVDAMSMLCERVLQNFIRTDRPGVSPREDAGMRYNPPDEITHSKTSPDNGNRCGRDRVVADRAGARSALPRAGLACILQRHRRGNAC